VKWLELTRFLCIYANIIRSAHLQLCCQYWFLRVFVPDKKKYFSCKDQEERKAPGSSDGGPVLPQLLLCPLLFQFQSVLCMDARSASNARAAGPLNSFKSWGSQRSRPGLGPWGHTARHVRSRKFWGFQFQRAFSRSGNEPGDAHAVSGWQERSS